MYQQIDTRKGSCPYCGETIEFCIDLSVEHQSYIEDCQVCCRPINVELSVFEDGEAQLVLRHEDE